MADRKRWSVTSMTPRDKIKDSGVVVSGYDVAFSTAGGHVGTVFVPKATFDPDTVAAAVDELAQQVDVIGGLTSDHLDT